MIASPLVSARVFSPLVSRASRGNHAAPGPAAYRRATAAGFLPSATATVGALSIFVEGARLENPRVMMFGLSLLRDASTAHVEAAIVALENSGVTDAAEVHRLLTSR